MMLTIFLFVYLVFAGFLLFIVASAFSGYVRTRVPFVPTAGKDIRFVLDTLALTEYDVVYELGSGNGKVAFYIDKLTPARAVGFEMMLWTHLWATLKKKFTKSRAEFVRGDFFKHSWSEATVIYCYLYPHLMSYIGEKAKQECKPGTRIVCRDFYIGDWTPEQQFKSPKGHTIYIYTV